MVLLYVYWPASPVVAVAAVVCGVLGLRAAERGFGGKGRAMVGLFYAATALVVLGVILYLFYSSGLPVSSAIGHDGSRPKQRFASRTRRDRRRAAR